MEPANGKPKQQQGLNRDRERTYLRLVNPDYPANLEGQNQPTTPAEMPLAELGQKVEELRSSLDRSRGFVKDQEEELTAQGQVIEELEAKIKGLRGKERQDLEAELLTEREKRAMLEATLVGQRRNLRKQETIYEQYSQVLEQRQSQELGESSPKPAENALTAGEKAKRKWQWPRRTLVLGAAALCATGATALYSLQQLRPSSAPSSVTVNPLLEREGVSALGYLQPQEETIQLSASLSAQGIRVAQLLVKQGEKVKASQIVAVLDNRERLQAALKQAEAETDIARARLEQVQAGAKQGDIQAQDAKYQGIQAELQGQIATQRAAIASLQAEFQGEKRAQVAAIERLTAELSNAQKDCSRYQRLHQDGAVSVQERERACLGQETAAKRRQEAQANLQRLVESWQERIREARANLQRTAATLQEQAGAERAALNSIGEVRTVDVRVAQAQLQAARAAVQKAKAELEEAYVRAPKGGQILEIYTRPGEVVGDRGIVSLGQTQQMYVKAEVYQTDISRVRVGQRVRIESDGIVSGLQGRVEQIGLQIGKQGVVNTNPAADVDARVVEVLIRLTPQDSQKVARLTNLQVNAIIETGS